MDHIEPFFNKELADKLDKIKVAERLKIRDDLSTEDCTIYAVRFEDGTYGFEFVRPTAKE